MQGFSIPAKKEPITPHNRGAKGLQVEGSKKWPRIYERRYTSGEIGYVVDLGMINGKRIRKTFETLKEAEAYAEQVRREYAKEGELAFTVPIEIRIEAQKCMEQLAAYNATLTEATGYYIKHYLVHRKAPTVAVMVDGLLQEKMEAGLRPESINTMRCFLKKFAEKFGERQLHTVTLEELKALCLDPTVQPRTRWNRIRLAKQLYLYAISKGWAVVNLAESIPVPVWDTDEPGILTVEQARWLLAQAQKFGVLGYVVLALFCGIRRAELLRMDWSAVNTVDREVTVSAKAAKIRSRRVIPYGDTAAAWLAVCAQEQGPIIDDKKLALLFETLWRAAGIDKWPKNALRHSFASYHVAHFQDPVRTAYLMGHKDGTDMLDSHYKGLVRGAAAAEFWALRPETGTMLLSEGNLPDGPKIA